MAQVMPELLELRLEIAERAVLARIRVRVTVTVMVRVRARARARVRVREVRRACGARR